MLRKRLIDRNIGNNNVFIWRGEAVSRVEGFSDAVFAFAVTLLVVSLEVPKTFTELIGTMSGFLAFGVCFTFLIWIWYSHYIFFRRYGFEDTYTTVLNAFLLFLVLFYIYPLKFLFTFLIESLTGLGNAGIVINVKDTPLLMIIYSLGFFAVFTIFFLLYLYAYNKNEDLQLSEAEIFHTRFNLQAHLIYMSIAMISVLIALIGGEGYSFWSGAVYIFTGPSRAIHGMISGRKYKKLFSQKSIEPSSNESVITGNANKD